MCCLDSCPRSQGTAPGNGVMQGPLPGTAAWCSSRHQEPGPSQGFPWQTCSLAPVAQLSRWHCHGQDDLMMAGRVQLGLSQGHGALGAKLALSN